MKIFDYAKYTDTKWSGKILSYVARIQEFKGRQGLFMQQKPSELIRLVELAKIQSTEASNKIEGIVTVQSRLKQLYADKTSPRTRDEKEIIGYRDVLNTIHESHDYISVSPSYILQLHRDLYAYSETEIGGKLKSVQNYISERASDGSSFVRFTPLAPYETPTALDELCAEYNKTIARCEVEPLVLIPIFILDFLCIHPFNDGNGRMSRLLTTLLLYRSGYYIGKYISIESKIEKTKQYYYDALRSGSAGWYDDENDPSDFIEYFLSVVLAAYRDFENRVDLVGVKRKSGEQTVEAAVQNTLGKFTKSSIMELCPNLSKATVENALSALVRNGVIERCGTGKATYYVKKQ